MIKVPKLNQTSFCRIVHWMDVFKIINSRFYTENEIIINFTLELNSSCIAIESSLTNELLNRRV